MEFELLKLEVSFEKILGPFKLRSWVYGSLLFSLESSNKYSVIK